MYSGIFSLGQFQQLEGFPALSLLLSKTLVPFLIYFLADPHFFWYILTGELE